MPEGKGVEPAVEPHCGHQAVADLAAAVSRLCAALISDQGAVQASLGPATASLCDREAFCAASRSQPKKINRAQYSGISTSEDYKPVMQRWSSQRQRYRPCPDAPGWPAISSCSPGARQPFLRPLPPFIYAPFCSCLLRCPSCHTGRCPGLARSLPLCGADLRMPVGERDLLNFCAVGVCQSAEGAPEVVRRELDDARVLDAADYDLVGGRGAHALPHLHAARLVARSHSIESRRESSSR